MPVLPIQVIFLPSVPNFSFVDVHANNILQWKLEFCSKIIREMLFSHNEGTFSWKYYLVMSVLYYLTMFDHYFIVPVAIFESSKYICLTMLVILPESCEKFLHSFVSQVLPDELDLENP